MTRYTTLFGVFVSVFLITLGFAAVGGVILDDERTDQPDIETEQWQLDNVTPEGAEEGGEITMDSNEATKTVVVHIGTSTGGTGTGLQLPLQGENKAVTTGSPAGQERSVDALVSTLVANGHEIEFYSQSTSGNTIGQDSSLSGDLADADAFVTVAPASLSADDRTDVTTFAEEGGRIFIGADPGQAEGVIEIGSEAGIYQETGFLYNMVENDQNFLSIFAEPSGTTVLTDGVDQTVFRGAAPIGQFENSPVLTTGEETELTTTQQTGRFGVAAVDGNISVVGDTSFMSPENAYRTDNNVLIGNVADFLVTGNVSENPFSPAQNGTDGAQSAFSRGSLRP